MHLIKQHLSENIEVGENSMVKTVQFWVVSNKKNKGSFYCSKPWSLLPGYWFRQIYHKEGVYETH